MTRSTSQSELEEDLSKIKIQQESKELKEKNKECLKARKDLQDLKEQDASLRNSELKEIEEQKDPKLKSNLIKEQKQRIKKYEETMAELTKKSNSNNQERMQEQRAREKVLKKQERE